MIRSFVLSSLAVILYVAPAGAMSVAERENHVKLAEAVIESGVEVSINTKEHCFSLEHRFYGFYNPSKRVIAICQENTTDWNGEVIPFSEEDYDTLRHESHHLVQDCLDGDIDGRLQLMFTGADKEKFLADYPESRKNSIRESYAEAGEEMIQLEIEAFAVAEGAVSVVVMPEL